MSCLLLLKQNTNKEDEDMTHREDSTPLSDAMEAIAEHGMEGMGTALQILFNEAMKIERVASSAPLLTSGPRSDRGMPTGSSPRR